VDTSQINFNPKSILQRPGSDATIFQQSKDRTRPITGHVMGVSNTSQAHVCQGNIQSGRLGNWAKNRIPSTETGFVT
jgi:hypothetical protein